MQHLIREGTRAVNIYSQSPKRFDARLYVNCEPELQGPECLGTATLTSRTFKTIKGAMIWAHRILAQHR